MGSNKPKTLRVRCNPELFKHFKRIAADYNDYEEALQIIIDGYERYTKLHPEYTLTKDAKYVVVKSEPVIK